MLRRSLLVAALLAAGTSPAATQQPPPRDSRPFRTQVDLTTITVTVTDAQGHLVTGLGQDAFEVFEDGERQTVTQFTSERVPISVGVLLDISDSMFGQRLIDARTAIERFLFELLKPSDESFLLSFNHAPHVLTTWTTERTVIEGALGGLKPFGGTAIYDAVAAGLPMIDRRAKARGALLIISDGADTASDFTLQTLRGKLLRSDAFIYAVAIDSPSGQPINTRVNVQALNELTAQTGGRAEIVKSSTDLVDATARIAEELNSQYLIGYTPSRGGDGKFHSIRVRVNATGYRIRARNGYVSN